MTYLRPELKTRNKAQELGEAPTPHCHIPARAPEVSDAPIQAAPVFCRTAHLTLQTPQGSKLPHAPIALK